jgi:hypothetical protein
MARNRQRVCLQDGLKLDINQLARNGLIRRGTGTSAQAIQWISAYWGEVARGVVTADLPREGQGWFSIELAGEDCQRIALIARPRHFGGRQWYFSCPKTGRLVSVLWRPPGARWFASRQAWGRQVAYRSQYLDRDSRAHAAQSKINARLCSIGGFDPQDWDLPPKPKWMRWKTYHRHEAKFDHYEAVLDYGCAAMAAKLTGLKIL